MKKKTTEKVTKKGRKKAGEGIVRREGRRIRKPGKEKDK